MALPRATAVSIRLILSVGSERNKRYYQPSLKLLIFGLLNTFKGTRTAHIMGWLVGADGA